ncbi:MAG: hypothetical protein AAB152_03270 [Candidatus Coatesbacteria bacterium]
MKGRKVVAVENGVVKAEVLPGGGHLGAISLLSGVGAGINPLWEVPWRSMEPKDFSPKDLDEYGGPPEGRLLASIMGHNPCLAWFGAPSEMDAARGFTVHGEAPVATWATTAVSRKLITRVALPLAGLDVERTYSLGSGSPVLRVATTIQNMGADCQFGWQEHATFGPPFVEDGVTAFDTCATWGATIETSTARRHRLKLGAEWTWPMAPGEDGQPVDLRVFPTGEPSGDFTTQLMDPARKWAWFTAVNPKLRLLCGYAWKREESPWLGNWEERRDRLAHPWDGRTTTRGMEFGVSPFPLGNEAMRKMGKLRGTPTLATLRAGGWLASTFLVFVAAIPEACTGVRDVTVEPNAVAVSLLAGETLTLKR